MATPCFYLSLTIRGYDAEVFLNGAPIIRAVRAYQCVTIVPVSEWVVQGENVLSVRVDGGEPTDPHVEEAERRAAEAAGEVTGPDTLAEPGDLRGGGDEGEGGDDLEAPVMRVALCEGIIGEIVDPGQERERVVLEWEPPPVPTSEDEAPLPLPHEVSESGDVSHPWGTWAWESAPVIDLEQDPGALVDVLDFLRAIHDALGQGQLDALVNASPLSYDEVAPCYDIDPADARGRLALAWPDISGQPGFRLADFEETDLELRPCCGGRVLEPRSLDGSPFLRQAEAIDGARWMLPVFLARIGDDLQIVR